MNSKTHEQTLQYLEFHFIELSKFHKTIDELCTVADKWIFLIKNSENMGTIPDQLKKPHEMAEALHVLERSYWTEMEFQKYLMELDEWRRRESYEEAIRLELEKERQERKKERFEITRKMLAASISRENIAAITGLSLDEIQALPKA